MITLVITDSDRNTREIIHVSNVVAVSDDNAGAYCSCSWGEHQKRDAIKSCWELIACLSTEKTYNWKHENNSQSQHDQRPLHRGTWGTAPFWDLPFLNSMCFLSTWTENECKRTQVLMFKMKNRPKVWGGQYQWVSLMSAVLTLERKEPPQTPIMVLLACGFNPKLPLASTCLEVVWKLQQ
jgi:hypothetical protein